MNITTDSIEVNFILVMEEKLPQKDFSLKNLRGSSKIDVVSRVILSAFPNEHPTLQPTIQILFTKETPAIIEVKTIATETALTLDEISMAAQIRARLNDEPLQSGIELEIRKVVDINNYFSKLQNANKQLFYLHESGEDLRNILPLKTTSSIGFILGGRHDIAPEHEAMIDSLNIPRLSLGSISYLASTCIVYLLYELKK